MNKIVHFSFCFITLTALSAFSRGQGEPITVENADSNDFALFESLDNTSSNSASSAPGRNNPRERGTRNTQAMPTFVLIGTSTIGSAKSALLKHMNGDVIRVPLTGLANPVPGHESYTMVNHAAREVSIRYPQATPCDNFPEHGISCDTETNIASLSLTTANAIVLAEDVAITESDESELEEDATRNPFEAIRERNQASGSNQATPATRFQPRRIDPADVPPGMRVVSTPFGDRLVQQ